MLPPWTFYLLLPVVTCTVAGTYESYDVTTILKLETSPTSSDVYESYGSLNVYTRGNARGLPLRRGQTFISGTFAGQPCCTSWLREGWEKLDSATAEAARPPLDPQETATDGEIGGTGNSTDTSDKPAVVWNRILEEYATDENKVWRGQLPLGARARVTFLTAGNATLGLYLCSGNKTDNAQKECVSFLLKGFNSTGSVLNYQAVKYSQNETGPETETPLGKFKSKILFENTSTSESWDHQRVEILLEHSPDGSFGVRLDGGDTSQRRAMILNGTLAMTEFAAIVLSGDANNDSSLEVRADSTWKGKLRVGGEVRIRWIPPNSGSGHLGIFMCQDRFQERCLGEVLSGHIDGNVRFVVGAYGPEENSTMPYWIAGNEELNYRVTELARSQYVRARWEPVRPYSFSVSRTSDGSIRIRLDGADEEKDQRWAVPKEYQHFFIASYHNEGRVFVQAAQGRCGGSTACTAPAPLWVLGTEKGELRSPSIPATASGRRICVSVIARLSRGTTLSVAVQATGETSKMEMDKLGPLEQTEWLIRRISRTTTRFVRKKPLEILLTAQQPAGTQEPIIVQWAAACNPEGDEDVYSVSESTSLKVVSSQLGFDVMYNPNQAKSNLGSTTTQPNPVCLHGGALDISAGLCKCMPGFTGDVCERGCGPNAYGKDCQGRCSRTSGGRQCRGMLLCGAGGTCDCAPGLTGPRCDAECEPGRYGPGCRRACGRCFDGAPCDPFTGHCEDGCDGALQPPFCLEECGRQRTAVSLISGGADARAEDFPWHAGVYDTEYRNSSNLLGPPRTEQICAATLVKPKLLISAAHCFYSESERKLQDPKRYKIALGKTFRGWNDAETPPNRVQRRDVILLHVPKTYKGSLLFYVDDIALVEVDSNIVASIYVAPVCYDWAGGYNIPLDESSKGSVVGWGKTENSEPSRQLKLAVLPYVPTEQCLERVFQTFWPFINKDKFCAGDKEGAAVGNGDSGGGMVFFQQGAWYLRGVVSVGPPADLSFTAYSNVSTFRDWLTKERDTADIRSAVFFAFLGN